MPCAPFPAAFVQHFGRSCGLVLSCLVLAGLCLGDDQFAPRNPVAGLALTWMARLIIEQRSGAQLGGESVGATRSCLPSPKK